MWLLYRAHWGMSCVCTSLPLKCVHSYLSLHSNENHVSTNKTNLACSFGLSRNKVRCCKTHLFPKLKAVWCVLDFSWLEMLKINFISLSWLIRSISEEQIGSLHSQSAAYSRHAQQNISQPVWGWAEHSHTEPTVLSENDNLLSVFLALKTQMDLMWNKLHFTITCMAAI